MVNRKKGENKGKGGTNVAVTPILPPNTRPFNYCPLPDEPDRSWRTKRHGRNEEFTDELKALFLHWLERTGRWAESARAVGLSYECIRQHREKDEDFGNACEEAMATYKDTLRAACYEQAVVGILEPIFDKGGRHVGWKRKLDGSLLQFEMKAKIPEEYRDRQEIDMNVQGAPLVVPPTVGLKEWTEEFDKYLETVKEDGDDDE